MKSLTINLPEDTDLKAAKMIIAATMFDKGILSSGQAAAIAEFSRREFLENVGQFGVSIFQYSPEELERDIQNQIKFRR